MLRYVVAAMAVRPSLGHGISGGAEVAADAEDDDEADVGEDGELPALGAAAAGAALHHRQHLVPRHRPRPRLVRVHVRVLSPSLRGPRPVLNLSPISTTIILADW